jgi:hypothetical protein
LAATLKRRDRAFSSLAKEEFVNLFCIFSKQTETVAHNTRAKTTDQRFYEKRKKMFRRKKESWLLSILILPLIHAYGPIYTEGTSITHRNGAYCLVEAEIESSFNILIN